MEQALLNKKYKQNMHKLNSIINQYEDKLDTRVNAVISQILNHTKKISDPPLIPVVTHKKVDPQQHKKTTSFNHQLSFLTDTTLQSQMHQLRGTYKNVQSEKVIPEPGRSVGNHPIKRPRFAKKKPDVLPKQMRLNPFAEKNAIKTFELDKGLYNLLQKGKIGKDVNIITAFQKGKPILQAHKVIFHEGQQRFAQLQPEKAQTVQKKDKQQRNETQKNNKFEGRQRIYDQNWALTMPKDEQIGGLSNTYDNHSQQKTKLQFMFREHIYLKIINFKAAEDKNYKLFINQNKEYMGQIRQILHQLQKVMHKYSIDIAYADHLKILSLITRTNKIQKEQLIGCLVNKNNVKFFSIRNIRIHQLKRQPALDKIVSCFQYHFYRKQFLSFLKKKKVANRIYGWVVSRLTVRKREEQVIVKRKGIEESHQRLQNILRQSYDQIQSQKHYEIHIINESLEGRERYRQYVNCQITRIFNVKNINKHIIFLLNERLDEETINYNYKIMELEEIPNYKERVLFMEVDPKHFFKQPNITLSNKYYYNSKLIRKMRKKIKDVPAYLVISYPTPADITLSTYLNLPILGGNLLKNFHLEKLSHLAHFNIDLTDRYIIKPDGHNKNLTAFSNELIQYCTKLNISYNKFVVKLNSKHRSLGLGLLTFPFTSLPDLYQNTLIISSKLTVDQFYHLLLREGGIIERYDESISEISAVIFIQTSGEYKVEGTFQKVSSGFINIAYNFPQKKIDNRWLMDKVSVVARSLYQEGHFGYVELSFLVDQIQQIYLQKVQCYFTHLGSCLFYYKFLSQGEVNENGQYMAKIIESLQKQGGTEQQVISLEPRSFSYVPYLLHFGLSDRQINSFFQLCRMGGVSFDLQNKYGATFILIGSLKKSMGLITTAKDKKGAIKLMVKSIEFVLKQNSHNMSIQTLAEKQLRMKERENIINIKQRFEDM